MKKKATTDTDKSLADDLRAEYRFDYRKAKPNRFAAMTEEDRTVVVLDPDVSKVFRTPDSVNAVLRAVVEALPGKPARGKTSGPGQDAKR